MSLKQKAVSGVKWTTFSSVIVAILQIVQLVILARLLEPTVFGLMAITSVVIGFAQAFLDMGISNAIIHKQEVSHTQLSSLYWLNVLSGIVLFLIVSLCAPVVALFYQEAELTNIIILVAMTFLIQPFGQQFIVLWQKELKFNDIAKVDILTKLVALIVSIVFAYYNYGVYALVYGVLAGTILQTLVFVYKGLREYTISFVFRLSDVREFLSFGLYQMAEKTLNYFNSQIDTLLIGKLLGVETLGVYNIAKQIIMKPIQIINPIVSKVTFPVMAKIQNDTDRLKEIYLKTINLLSSINFPIYLFMLITAPQLVPLMFGEQWVDAVIILQILSIYGALRSIGNPVGSLLLAKGRADWGFYWNLGLFFYVPIVIYLFSRAGIETLSWGMVGIMVSLITPMWYLLVRPLVQAKFWEFHKQIATPAFISMLIGVVISIVLNSLSHLSSFMTLFLTGIIISLGVLILNYLFNKQLIHFLRRTLYL
ncbi:MOP flippase family protein [Psychrobacter celer]|uniref:MOP flippase family protein n=1 Tax=Psychrobacter celer TaxID=306572 RepID=UPI002FE47D42